MTRINPYRLREIRPSRRGCEILPGVMQPRAQQRMMAATPTTRSGSKQGRLAQAPSPPPWADRSPLHVTGLGLLFLLSSRFRSTDFHAHWPEEGAFFGGKGTVTTFPNPPGAADFELFAMMLPRPELDDDGVGRKGFTGDPPVSPPPAGRQPISPTNVPSNAPHHCREGCPSIDPMAQYGVDSFGRGSGYRG